MIKSFVVKMKPVKFEDKGLKNLLSYLVDKKRHKSGIINFKELSDAEKFFNKTFVNIQHYEAKKKFNGLAGRNIKSYADSYIFTIPPEFFDKANDPEKLKKLTLNIIKKFHNQMKKIYEYEKEKLKNKLENATDEKEITKLKKELEKYKNFIGFDTFVKNIFVNIHTNKHIHLNIIIPRIYSMGNGQYFSNRITNRKNFISKIKQQWNLAVLEELNINYEDYKPKTKFHRGYKNQYFKDLINKNNKTLEKIEEKEKEIKELKEIIELKRSEIKKYTSEVLKETKELKEENNRREEIIKAFQLMIRYYKSIANKIQKKEMKGLLKDYNKVKEKIKIIKELTTNQNLIGIAEEVENNINTWQSQSLGY